MKYLFYVWCLLRKVSLRLAMVMWLIYRHRQNEPWFQKHIAQNIFQANVNTLLRISPIFDFLNDDGVRFVFEQFDHYRPSTNVALELGTFTSDFVASIGSYYMHGHGIDAYIVADDFAAVRQLYLRNLMLAIHPKASKAEEEELWKALLSYQLKPELLV